MTSKLESLFSNLTNTEKLMDHLKNKVVGGSCESLRSRGNQNIFNYTVNGFVKGANDKKVLSSLLEQTGGSTVLPMRYFDAHKNDPIYSSKIRNTMNYSDITCKQIRHELPMTFKSSGGEGYRTGPVTTTKRILSLRDTNRMLEEKNLIDMVGKKNLKLFNQILNSNINTFIALIKSNKKLTKKEVDRVFKEFIQKK